MHRGGFDFFFQAEDGIRDWSVTGVQTCALPISQSVGAQPAPVPLPASVAVLYFESPDSADAYLADGLTEAIITRLGRVERFTVKSRNAVRRFRGTSTDDPAALGRALGVTYLVSGSVRRTGQRGLHVS